ncbi:flippase-like domain-containing protein [Patescibacteria group bacterium]|nr:flippase-like domain-containing protein [Patescibacteria group bacterium]
MFFGTKTNKIKKSISIVILVSLLGWLFSYFLNNIGDFKNIFLLDRFDIALLVLIYTASLFINGVILKILVSKLGGKIRYKESFLLSVATSFFNFITPFRGGAGIRALYLKKVHNFDYTKFIVTLVGSYLVLFLVISSMLLIATTYLFIKYNIFNLAITILFGSFFIGLIFFIIASPKNRPTKNWLVRKVFEVSNGWDLIKQDGKLLFHLFLLNIIYVLLGTFFMYITFTALGINIAFFKVLYFNLISFVSFFINVTPASLGVYEGVLFVTSSIVGILPSDALIFAVIFRVIGFLVTFLLFVLFGRYLYGEYYEKKRI